MNRTGSYDKSKNSEVEKISYHMTSFITGTFWSKLNKLTMSNKTNSMGSES